MSATLSGIVVLENATAIDGLPSTVQFHGQMWLGEGRILIGKYRYYNAFNLSFDDVGQYFAWIHIAKFSPEPNNEMEASVSQVQPSESQSDEETHVAQTLASGHSDEIEDIDDFHVVGDIVYMIPTFAPETRQISFLNISGVALHSNKVDGFFEINAAQYTSFYKSNRALSILPVRASFNPNKYKTKLPIPSNNTYVSVEGVLQDVEITNGRVTRFLLSVDNISFLGRASNLPSTPASSSGGLGSSPSPSRRFRYRFDLTDLSPSSTTPPSELELRSAAATAAATAALPVQGPGPSTRAGKRKK